MTRQETLTSDDSIRFPSLESLRSAHSELLKRFRTDRNSPEMVAEVEAFIRRGKATGALLDNDDDRWDAQSQLDYWTTQLYKPGYNPPDATIDNFDPTLAPELDDSLCPYMGLDAFNETKQSIFFGRGRLIDDMVNALKTSRFLAVLGASGSGKSSLVRAGLIPALKKGELTDSQGWTYLPPVVPGSHPLENLARLIIPHDASGERIDSAVDRLRHEPGHLPRLVSEHHDGKVVLVIDQFEEVFTLCQDDVERDRYVDNLISLCREPGTGHRVILTMRSDFETNVARLAELQEMVEQNEFRVTSFSAGELREAIEAPASQIGLKFEEGVVDALMQEILGEPAALPLLQFTLLKLWENRDRNRVTWETYRKLGGGRNALARSADEFFRNLIHEEQVTMRRILLRMVRPGEGLEITSSRIQHSDLYEKGEASDRIDRVLEKLIQARLVRVSEGDSASTEQVEIAHEALVRNWPRLVEWLEEERVALRQRQRLTTAAEEWQRLNRASSALWRRELLEEARRYDDLTELESRFVKASSTRERRVRFAWLAGVTVLFTYLVIATLVYRDQRNDNALLAQQNAEIAATAQAASTLAVAQQSTAVANEETAIQQAELALANGLSSQAQLILGTRDSKQMTAVLLAIRSIQLSPSVEASQILQNNTLASPVQELKHESPIVSAAFNMDGTQVLSAGNDGIVHIWDAVTGDQIVQFDHEGGVVTEAGFSPDGRFVSKLTCSISDSSGKCRSWSVLLLEVETGREIFRWTQSDIVNAVSLSADGKYVASGNGDSTIQVREIATGEKTVESILDGRVIVTALSSDGDFLAAGGCDKYEEREGDQICTGGVARVWDGRTAEVISEIRYENSVNTLAFSPAGNLLVSGIEDGTARVAEFLTGSEVARVTHDGPVRSVSFGADGVYILSGSADGTARLWEAETGNEIARMTHDEQVSSVAVSPNGRLMVSVSADGVVRVWEPAAGNEVTRVVHGERVYHAAFSHDGRYVVSAGCDERDDDQVCTLGMVRVWETLTGDKVAEMKLGSFVNMVAFSPDGTLVAAGGCKTRESAGVCREGAVWIWEVASGSEKHELVHKEYVYAIAFSKDGKHLISGSWDNTARVWDVSTGEEVSRVTHMEHVRSVAFSPDGKYVVSGSRDRTVWVWEATSGDTIARFVHDDDIEQSVAFSPNGRYVASGGADETARVFNLVTGREIARLPHDGNVLSVAFSPDSQFLATGSEDNTARVWEVATGEEVSRLTHDDIVRSVVFNLDGNYVASGSYDGTARVWEALTGNEVARMTHENIVYSVEFSPNGKYVVSGSLDATARVWLWQTRDFIESACAHMPRNLTQSEWNQYFGALPYQQVCPDLPIHPTVIREQVSQILSDPDTSNRVQRAIDTAVSLLTDGLSAQDRSEQAEELVKGVIDEKITEISKQGLESGALSPYINLLAEAKYSGLSMQTDPGLLSVFAREALEDSSDPTPVQTAVITVRGLIEKISTAGDPDAQARQLVENLIEERIAEISELNLDPDTLNRYLGLLAEAKDLGLNIKADSTLLSAVALEALEDTSDPNPVQTAITTISDLMIRVSTESNPEAEARALVREVLEEVLLGSDWKTGDIDHYLTLLEGAKEQGLEITRASKLNHFCWHGSIRGYASDVLEYCEAAVAISPDRAAYRDSRGLARALTGDYAGAIDDFQFFVDSGEFSDDWTQQRRDWIKALRAGEDPFTPEVLESIIDQ